ncbi:nuclease-related domain-containing protein [Sediminibacillus albus]|uniref:Nuclease-related domain-containing protein n=1 Tax=Sediminibacillus albus TaxID=407036 RepID=A0A1G8ZH66_9BACI|nr:nuclease-related domain-containing protein [Sediminibacillus albus]SDK13934.1 Nuclease-related domain-containing protein [Sediminibacillus albus]
MIVKKRLVPHRLQVLEALMRRLNANHPKMPSIKEDFARRISGFQGEQNIDYQLSLLPQNSFCILNDLRLPNKQYFFQIDSLLLNRKFAVIIEIKNITGTLLFDQSFKQLIRTIDGQEEGFQYPLLQADNQRRQLLEFFQQHELNPLPIETLVVISNPETVIKASYNPDEISNKVIHSELLVSKLNELKAQYVERPSIPLEPIQQKLLASHRKETIRAYMMKGVKESEIKTGVECPQCHTIPMVRLHSRWHCPYCRHDSRDAHNRAISDYLLLIKPSITNRECQRFLHLHSRHTAKRLLKFQLSFSGKSNKRVYYKG